MSATRSRKEEKDYKAYLTTLPKGICVFCDPPKEDFVEETKLFRVIRNLFSYSIWDGQKAVDHLMIVPKQHTDSIASFSDDMVLELHKVLSKYEKLGYNIYARAPASKIKSVSHQHTHLIKTEGDAKRFILLNRKPYFRFTT